MLDFGRISDWIIAERNFDPTALGKAEANFCLGNGYLGLRSATEESYPGETRDLLVAGTFDRFSDEEVTELPNAADVTNIEITLDGERFDLTQGRILDYNRELNLKTGLLKREVVWESPRGARSTHSVLACDIGDADLGYQMFRKACEIDLGNDNMHSSDAGIHAASYGGLWQCVVYGFGGLRMVDGRLRIAPKLPEKWSRLSYTVLWHGQKLKVAVTKDAVHIQNETNTEPVFLEVAGTEYRFENSLKVSL